MNPFHLDATGLMVWGLVAHLIADWPLQNDWMANNKARLGSPASCVHAAIHGFALSWVFGWAAIPLAVVHALIDTRVPVVWWSRLVRQTQPTGMRSSPVGDRPPTFLVDVGLEVRFWTDQVFHIACIAVAALAVAA
jgi:hypothetical protein